MNIKTEIWNGQNMEFTYAEMVERLNRFNNMFGHGDFSVADFKEYYEMFCPGGDCEDEGFAADMRGDYPNLCAGVFDEVEWEEYVRCYFWDLRECDPRFPQD